MTIRESMRPAIRAYQRVRNNVASQVRGGPDKRFIYFAHSRSGSHLFADLLNAHPNINCVTEHGMFVKHRGIRNPTRFIEGASRLSSDAVYGAKVSYRQLERQQADPLVVIKDLADNGWQFIVLERSNVFLQTISAQVARNRKLFHDLEVPEIDALTLTVDVDRLLEQMRNKIALSARTQSALHQYSPLQIGYEAGLIGAEAQQKTCDRVFDWLELDSVRVSTGFVKSGTPHPVEYVQNYEEVVAALTTNGFEHYLEGDER